MKSPAVVTRRAGSSTGSSISASVQRAPQSSTLADDSSRFLVEANDLFPAD